MVCGHRPTLSSNLKSCCPCWNVKPIINPFSSSQITNSNGKPWVCGTIRSTFFVVQRGVPWIVTGGPGEIRHGKIPRNPSRDLEVWHGWSTKLYCWKAVVHSLTCLHDECKGLGVLWNTWVSSCSSKIWHANRKNAMQDNIFRQRECCGQFLAHANAARYWKTRTLPWKHWKETACDLRKFKHIATHQPSMCYQIGMHLGIKWLSNITFTSESWGTLQISGCFSVHHRELGFQGKCFLGSLPSTAGSRG